VHEGRTDGQRAADVELLRTSGVHKLVIADYDGTPFAYLLAWDSFEYDADTDTYVFFAARDGRELMTLYTEGEVRRDPQQNMYQVTAPVAVDERETGYAATDVVNRRNGAVPR
jgi:hypothetical protein